MALNHTMRDLTNNLASELEMFAAYIHDRCRAAGDTGPSRDVGALLRLLADNPEAVCALAVFSHLLPSIKLATALKREFGDSEAAPISPATKSTFDALMARVRTGG